MTFIADNGINSHETECSVAISDRSCKRLAKIFLVYSERVVLMHPESDVRRGEAPPAAFRSLLRP